MGWLKDVVNWFRGDDTYKVNCGGDVQEICLPKEPHDIAIRAASNAAYRKYKKSPKQWAEAYIKANPDVYQKFRHFALIKIGEGKTKLTHQAVATSVREDGTKVHNSATSYLARKFVQEYPQFRGMFNFRKEV